jgi:SAM-dependent methyltransferase
MTYLGEDRAFDAYADNYDEALARGLSVSGEDKEFFIRGRIAWLATCLEELKQRPGTVMDLGCGTGAATPILAELSGAVSVLGLDVSAKSLELARRSFGSSRIEFRLISEHEPDASFDLAFCNGVFHHIPPDRRDVVAQQVRRLLKPGGLFALWENNPWNPGTRYVMSRIPFDRDAVMLSSREATRLLRKADFEIVRTDFLFIFPRLLKPFRILEPLLTKIPAGAQYQVLARKPR